jgi:hypothetical protein
MSDDLPKNQPPPQQATGAVSVRRRTHGVDPHGEGAGGALTRSISHSVDPGRVKDRLPLLLQSYRRSVEILPPGDPRRRPTLPSMAFLDGDAP